MNLWTERDRALEALDGELSLESQLVDRAFQQAEYLAQALGDIGRDDQFARVAALAAAKSRSLAQGVYSLMLDQLGQEAGATLRVWVETIELLTYLRLEPSRALEFAEGRLPSAGRRAQEIEGFTKGLRAFLNKTAAHVGVEADTWMHVANLRTGQVKTRFQFSSHVLRRNMGDLFAYLTWNIRESALCLEKAQGFVSESLAVQIDDLKTEGFEVFHGPGPEPTE